MKHIKEEDMVEITEWVCPYKKCGEVNQEYQMSSYTGKVRCQNCGREVIIDS